MEEGDVRSVAALLSRAFWDDPAYAFIFPDGETRTAKLADLFARNLRIHLPYRCTHVLERGGDILGTVTVRPPGGVPISLMTKIRHGLLPFTVANGLRGAKRLLYIADLYDKIEAEMARGPHWHVHMMGVEPGHQGRGHGGALLRKVLDRTSNTTELPTVLTTHKEPNVVFYRRLGFEVTETRTLSPGSERYRVWCMRRSALS
jgi:GNAT superfamily N-acetyltransferase